MIKNRKSDVTGRSNFKEFSTKYGIKWIFSTSLAPHHNGSAESFVKSVKSTLNKIVKDRVLTEEEYQTILMEI